AVDAVAFEREPEDDARVTGLLEHRGDVLDEALELFVVAARGLDRFDQARVDSPERPRDDCANELLAAPEMMQHRRVRDAGVGRDLLEPNARRAGRDQPALGDVQNQLARGLGVEATAGAIFSGFRHLPQDACSHLCRQVCPQLLTTLFIRPKLWSMSYLQ